MISSGLFNGFVFQGCNLIYQICLARPSAHRVAHLAMQPIICPYFCKSIRSFSSYQDTDFQQLLFVLFLPLKERQRGVARRKKASEEDGGKDNGSEEQWQHLAALSLPSLLHFSLLLCFRLFPLFPLLLPHPPLLSLLPPSLHPLTALSSLLRSLAQSCSI